VQTWAGPAPVPTPAAQPASSFAPPPGLATNAPVAPSAPQTDFGAGTTPGATEKDPYIDLEFGEYTEFADASAQPASEGAPRVRPGRARGGREDADATWDKVKEVHEPTTEKLAGETAAGVAPPAPPQVPTEAAPAATASISIADLDAIGSPAAAPAAAGDGGQWGNLDAIAAPTNTPARGGLGGKMIGKARASSSSGLFNKKKGMLGGADASAPGSSEEKAEAASLAPSVETKPAMNDEEATAKLKVLMDASNERSDYVFNTPGLDMRVLGRIDGWLNEIESKDGFVNGHAMQTAKYAVAIAEQAHLSKEQTDLIRQAALVHDVGKLG
jgi:hypothetical protein